MNRILNEVLCQQKAFFKMGNDSFLSKKIQNIDIFIRIFDYILTKSYKYVFLTRLFVVFVGIKSIQAKIGCFSC